MDLLIEFAKTGLGVACVIKEFVSSELTDVTLIEYPLDSGIPARKIGFVYPKTLPLSESMTQFIDFYKEDAQNK